MGRRLVHLACVAVVLGVGIVPAHAGLQDGLVAYFKLDETSGNFAADSSGNNNNGTLIGTALSWVPGHDGGALKIAPPVTGDVGERLEFSTKGMSVAAGTVAVWANLADPQPASSGRYIFGHTAQPQWNSRIQVYMQDGTNVSRKVDLGLGGNHTAGADVIELPMLEWLHVALTWNNGAAVLYVNGAQVAAVSYTGLTALNTIANFGNDGSSGPYEAFGGMLDEARVYNRALTVAEVRAIFLSSKTAAQSPSPADKAVDVLHDTALDWTASEMAGTHDVYFGKTFADVNEASRTNAKGVLAGQGQTAVTYDPTGVLEYGQTYYWRIDEVNKTPDNTIFKGNVWSFTVEPYGYPVKPVAATASSSQPGMGPEKTIDGSGLTADLHGTEPTTMWLAAGTLPAWIQYEFDKVYKLHELQVWNSNQLIEGMLGFGAKKVTVETSTDGTTWTPVANVPEFNRATGMPGYAANTTVSLGGADAKYVKLTITANWGGMAPQTGLAEVRFFYAPMQARVPEPTNAATGVSVEANLGWRPGRDAATHKVFFGTDPNAVTAGTASAKAVTDRSFAPGPLDLGTKYYWRVDEIGAVTYPGEVWGFTTQDYKVVDDFESYTDKTGTEVFTAWVDGFENPAKNGAIVGLATSVNGTFCDTTTFHGGRKSMPLAYDNTKASLSEATRTFAAAQDWTAAGIKTLVLFFYGDAANTGTELYVKINGTKIAYGGKASDLARRRWNQWNVDLSGVPAATLRSVKTLAIGITGGAGKLLVDDVRLYRVAPEIPAAVAPGANGLVAFYAMNNNVQDSSGKGNHGTAVGAPTYAAGLPAFGTALKLNGTSDCVDLGNKPVFNFAGSFSLSVWANIGAWTSNWNHVMVANRGENNLGWQLRRRDSNKVCFTTRAVGQDDTGSRMDAPLGEWVHIAAVYDNAANTKRIYINGVEDAFVSTTAGKVAATTHNTYIGARANAANDGREGYFTGMLDEVRIFDRALSASEVEFLSNPTP